ncbi:hypothetical protein [Peribacillus frigoritolerans]|uniref:hypothetical protein n=1 Tax=Peribacillus frigoritolerans TaxID=450367 RepID=UPI001070DC59|nr:hypothetical protein [Peribacillus frigoritolerans]TFH61191.1 hypothetical protein E4J71_12795 [Peribacillus frigoritolerans]
MSNNKIYTSNENVNDAYWRELKIRIDAFNDYSDEMKKRLFDLTIEKCSLEELKEILTFFDRGIVTKEKAELIKQGKLIPRDEQLLFLKIKEFLHRKKGSMKSYYKSVNNRFEVTFSTPLVQLLQLFKDSPAHLFSFYTYHLWTIRGSGNLFSLNKKVPIEKTKDLARNGEFEKELENRLFKASGEKHNYRIFSYCIINNQRVIILWYKQLNDITRPDFKGAIRNQEVEEMMYEVNIENQIMEMKIKTETEKRIIKNYLEDTYEGEFTLLKSDVFNQYNKQKVLDSVLLGKPVNGKNIADFQVESIHFRESLLKNSPEITIKANNIDVWSSIKDAHEKNCIHMTNIKDIAGMAVIAEGTRRNIRSSVLDNGHILLTMDDSRLEKDKKQSFMDKFFERFGIPLFQEISNEHFTEGRSDLVDYTLSQVSPENVQNNEQYAKLVERKVLQIKQEETVYCHEKDCTYEERILVDQTVPSECPVCEGEVRAKSNVILKTEIKQVNFYVQSHIRVLEKNGGWKKLNNSVMTFGKRKYDFINLERLEDRKVFQFLITEDTIPNPLLNRLIKQMTPIVIIFVGQHDLYVEKFTRDSIQTITFGKLFVLDEEVDILNLYIPLMNNLALRSKAYIASAASKAYESLCQLPKMGKEEAQHYDEDTLEDDVFAILKDIFTNATKWGNNKKGQAVPEGVFTISCRNRKYNKVLNDAYTFDCKYTEKDHYDLDRSEKRKAVEYVKSLSGNEYIQQFSNVSEISAHFFISNKEFMPLQVKSMVKFFEDSLSDDDERDEEISTIPVFITTEVLTYLHELYRGHIEEIQLAPNLFLRELRKALLPKDYLVTRNHIDQVFEKSLDEDLREVDRLNMIKLNKEVSVS